MSIRLEPELLIMSGGEPALILGCTTVEICSVAEKATLEFGHFLLYSGMCTSVAYVVLKPPLKMMISTGAFGSMPSGFSADFWPPDCCCWELSLDPLLTH